MEIERKVSAAYLPLATFVTALDHLKQISIPNKIDSGTFPNMSSQSKSQTLSALRFFELISDDGTPQPLLSDLAYKQDERKTLIKQLLETYYPDIVALDFAKITPNQLDAALSGKRYNIAGETKKKAKTFLLKAAQYAGFTVHPLLTKITRTRKKGAERNAAGIGKADQTGTNGGAGTTPNAVITTPPAPRGTEKTIEFRRGGSLSLALSVNLWELEADDRNFVLKLIDDIQAYEKGLTGSTAETNKVEKEAGE